MKIEKIDCMNTYINIQFFKHKIKYQIGKNLIITFKTHYLPTET